MPAVLFAWTSSFSAASTVFTDWQTKLFHQRLRFLFFFTPDEEGVLRRRRRGADLRWSAVGGMTP